MENESKALVPNGGYPMHTYDDVKAIFLTYIHNQDDIDLIDRAYELAKKMHSEQYRRSGEPYIQHPIEVAYIVCGLRGGPATIASAFLHDVVEDTEITIEQIHKWFGEDVAKIVDALTKIQRLKLSHRTEADFEAEDHKKIFIGMAKDVRVIIVKLADRLHNMRTLDSLRPERQQALSNETLNVFVPIAHRLGINTVQSELQDLCLKYIEPAAYQEVLRLVEERTNNRQGSLDSLKKRIADILFENKIKFRMESRVKSIYSIYRKMYQKNHSFDDIYDVMAVRIITETELNCYEILGIIHATYKPIPGRFKDYIAMPKPNMYQSLHTSIVSGDGQIYEIQIRTEEMDQIAETGVAAHWRYKEGSHYNAKEEQKEIEEKLHWFRDFVSMTGDNADTEAKEYMNTLQNDIFEANVYVFTPMGRVIDLPAGSTPLDFAYKIHTKVGDSAVGAVINGIGVPLNTPLKTGDVCEIRTSKSAPGPNNSWLEIAKTASAKSHIRRFIQKKESELMRDDNIRDGRASCIESFKAQDIEEKEMEQLLNQKKVFDEFHVSDLDSLYIAVAGRNPAPSAIIDFLGVRKKYEPDYSKIIRPNAGKDNEDKSPVTVSGGVTNLAITLAQCCSPIPGDEILGYITRGKGITVHRRTCPNIANDRKRCIDVFWKEDLGFNVYPVDIDIYASDRPNLVADILGNIGQMNVNCSDLRAHQNAKEKTCVISLTIHVTSAKSLDDVKALLLGIRGVLTIQRIVH